jgi:hypothetical protein
MIHELYSNDCRPNNPDHISPKRKGFVGVSVTVREATEKEILLGEQLLAPLRERLGLEPFMQHEPQVLQPGRIQNLLNRITRR